MDLVLFAALALVLIFAAIYSIVHTRHSRAMKVAVARFGPDQIVTARRGRHELLVELRNGEVVAVGYSGDVEGVTCPSDR